MTEIEVVFMSTLVQSWADIDSLQFLDWHSAK